MASRASIVKMPSADVNSGRSMMFSSSLFEEQAAVDIAASPAIAIGFKNLYILIALEVKKHKIQNL